MIGWKFPANQEKKNSDAKSIASYPKDLLPLEIILSYTAPYLYIIRKLFGINTSQGS
jgi:hypothetical protein